MQDHHPATQPSQTSFLQPTDSQVGEPSTPPVGWHPCSLELLESGVDCARAPRWASGAEAGHWHPPAGLIPLNAYQVGDYDVVAAFNPEGAILVLCEQTGEEPDEYDLEDVVLVSVQILDNMEAFDQDEGKVVQLEMSLRQELAMLTKPTYMYGWE